MTSFGGEVWPLFPCHNMLWHVKHPYSPRTLFSLNINLKNDHVTANQQNISVLKNNSGEYLILLLVLTMLLVTKVTT
jgi:hypothetical protein